MKGAIVLSEVRALAPFETLPLGAVPDGHEIPAGPFIPAHLGQVYLRSLCVSNDTEHLCLDI